MAVAVAVAAGLTETDPLDVGVAVAVGVAVGVVVGSQVRTLIQDIRDVRQSKIEDGLKKLSAATTAVKVGTNIRYSGTGTPEALLRYS